MRRLAEHGGKIWRYVYDPIDQTMKVLVNLLVIIGLPFLLVPKHHTVEAGKEVICAEGQSFCLSYPASLLHPVGGQKNEDIILVNADTSLEVVTYQARNIFDWDENQIIQYNLSTYSANDNNLSIVGMASTTLQQNAVIFRYKNYLHYHQVILNGDAYTVFNMSLKSGTLQEIKSLLGSINLELQGV